MQTQSSKDNKFLISIIKLIKDGWNLLSKCEVIIKIKQNDGRVKHCEMN